MTTVVQLKRNETAGAIPTANDIAVGELAVNLADGALYTKRTDGAIIEIGGSQEVPVFFSTEVDLGDLAGAGDSYDMGGLDGGSPSSGGGIALTSLSVTDSGGDGSLSYDNTTGVFSYTGPSSTDYRAAFSAGAGITITNGEIASTITQYSDSAARTSISVTDSGGDGSLSYNNTTGVFTYTGPSATEVRAHFSAGTGITITNGQVAVDTTTIATQTYVTTAISNLVNAAPTALDTLNELAAALGNDANFSTTISTALGNRLRIDVDNQSLTATQKTNALTNLGITASVDEINYIDGVTSSIQTQLNAKANTSSLATVATSGSYNDLTNKPAAGVSTGKAIAMAIVFGG